MPNYIVISIVFISAFLCTLISVPIVSSFALRFKLFDRPDERKQHKKNIVRLGGIAIFLGIYLSFFILVNLSLINIDNIFWTIFKFAPLFFLVGFSDDILNLSPFLRLFLQVTISTLVWVGGIQINEINLTPFLIDNISFNLSNTFSLLFTVFWIVGMINAINWMDGLDGLATGIIVMSILGLILITISRENFEGLIFLVSILGVCLSFLIYNLYPAKILMGDGGSYFLGFLSSTLSLHALTPLSEIDQGLDFEFVRIFLIFAIPLIDMVIVILSRMQSNKSIFFPDRSHIHHRLLDRGFKHKDAVTLILSLSQFLVCIAVVLTVNRFIPILISTSIFIMFSLILLICDKKNLLQLNIAPINKKN